MKKEIATILRANGVVQYPIKLKPKDWIDEVRISRWNKVFYVRSIFNCAKFDKIDEAVEAFIALVFTKNNLALCYEGIKNHGLTDNLFELSDEELEPFVAIYLEKYWDEDYPFLKESQS